MKTLRKTKRINSKSKAAMTDAEALAMVMEMMAIPGKSGEEAAIMEFVRKKLKAAGVPASAIEMDDAHKRTPFGGQVGNLVLKLPGSVRGPRRMLSAHVDTVPICVGFCGRSRRKLGCTAPAA
jgi:tripeptide aminopeptidase